MFKRARWVARLAILVSVGAAAFVVGTSPAHAAGIWTLTDAATGRCLDSNYAGSVYTLTCNGGNYQNWSQINEGSGAFEVRDMQTGLCLYYEPPVGTNPLSHIGTHACSDYNTWWLEVGGVDGTVFVGYWSSTVLDSNRAGSVYANDQWATGNLYQNWW
jgi:hypothetical protein